MRYGSYDKTWDIKGGYVLKKVIMEEIRANRITECIIR